MQRDADPLLPPEGLPYLIELRDAQRPDGSERVLARAITAQLARAIFTAAITEYPGRRIILRKGDQVVADSSR